LGSMVSSRILFWFEKSKESSIPLVSILNGAVNSRWPLADNTMVSKQLIHPIFIILFIAKIYLYLKW